MYTYEEFQNELQSASPRVQVTERMVGGMREITNTFYLNKVKTTDEGTYQCSMSNNFGRKISNEAVVTVQGMSYTSGDRYPSLRHSLLYFTTIAILSQGYGFSMSTRNFIGPG